MQDPHRISQAWRRRVGVLHVLKSLGRILPGIETEKRRKGTNQCLLCGGSKLLSGRVCHCLLWRISILWNTPPFCKGWLQEIPQVAGEAPLSADSCLPRCIQSCTFTCCYPRLESCIEIHHQIQQNCRQRGLWTVQANSFSPLSHWV